MEKFDAIEKFFRDNFGQTAKALPNHMNPDKVLEVSLALIKNNPKLIECTKESLFGAVSTASILGLELTKELGQAWLLPYSVKIKVKNTDTYIYLCQFQMGYKGMLAMMINTDKFIPVADVAYKCDAIKHERTLERDIFSHVKNYEKRLEDDLDWVYNNLTHCYLIARYKDGSPASVYVYNKEVVEKHRKCAKNQKPSKTSKPSETPLGIWKDHYSAMALKTAIRACCNQLPLSTEQLKAIQRDADIDLGAKIDYSRFTEGQEASVIVEPEHITTDPDEPKKKQEVPSDLNGWIALLIEVAETNSITEDNLRSQLESLIGKKLEESTEKKIVGMLYNNFVKKDTYVCNLNKEILTKIDEIRKPTKEVKNV